MKTIATMMIAAGLLGAAPKQTYTGVITDTMCGADHKAMRVSPDPKCVRECVKAGSKYALLAGSEVYTLSDQQTPDKYAGTKVKVTGTLNPKTKTIAVERIDPAK
ncbi:MAG: DUF5818 domain-containing protein [Acidobacteriota bacterium]